MYCSLLSLLIYFVIFRDYLIPVLTALTHSFKWLLGILMCEFTMIYWIMPLSAGTLMVFSAPPPPFTNHASENVFGAYFLSLSQGYP